MKGWAFFSRYKYQTAAVLLAVLAGCLYGLFHLQLDETIHAMLPAAVRGQVALFEHSPLQKKLIVVTESEDPSTSRAAAQTLRENLTQAGLITPPPALSADFPLRLYRALAPRFSPQDAQQTELRLTPQAVNEKMAKNYEQLFSFQSFLLSGLLWTDPLGLTDLMTQKLQAFATVTDKPYQDGLFSSSDERVWVAMYDLPSGSAQFSRVEQFASQFAQLAQKLPQGVRAFYLGALRYTQENVSVIRKDLVKITILAFVALAGVFWLFLRHKSALLIYLLPVFILPPAALVTYALFGGLSGITLGFGSVVAGLSVDYSVYIFFALRHSPLEAQETVAHLRRHLIYNYITSLLCFAALACSSVELFQQIAVFSVVGLTLALGLALYVFPQYWTHLPPLPEGVTGRALRPFSRRLAAIILLGLIGVGAAGVTFCHYSSHLEDLNTQTARFRQDRAAFDRVFGEEQQTNALLFVLGKTPQDALERSEQLSLRLPNPLPAVQLVPSETARQENLVRWRAFWSEDRVQKLRQTLAQAGAKWKFKPEAFEPFFDSLKNTVSPTDDVDFTAFYNPLAQLPDGRTAAIHIVPNQPAYRHAAEENGAVFLSAAQLQADLFAAVKYEALKIVFLALAFNLLAVGVLFKSVKKALLAFIPVVGAGCVVFGCFWLLGVQVNLLVLVFLPLLIGLTLDYGIFQVMKYQHGKASFRSVYDSRALAAAALSTLAGFGILAAAQHRVLFLIGISSSLGIGGAMFSALYILPAFCGGKK